MFLQKMKIKGFKSFARPITIDFSSSLTAIVGPNGSGKSNIVDAVRWVLGEQSAKTLRGSRMADVIFSGSDSHKPLSKASVTLYLDNRTKILPVDTREVKIARRVTEDGESDYLINDSICRLKDIKELLYDTGLGKEFYSIVGQGKIDSIINSKPGSLRELFVEAAGISKHKARKEEARKRLEKTNNKLRRLRDLISELDKRLKPLKKEAEKARKYEQLEENLRNLEVSLLLKRWEKNTAELASVDKNHDFLEEKIADGEDNLEEIKSCLISNREELEKKRSLLEKKEEEYYKWKTGREELNNRLDLYEEKVSNLVRERDRCYDRFASLGKRVRNLCEEWNIKSAALVKAALEKEAHREILEEYNRSLIEVSNSIKRKKDRLSSLREEILNGNADLQAIKTEYESSEEKIHLIDNRINELQKELELQEDEITDNHKLCRELKDELRELDRKKKSLGEKKKLFTEKKRTTGVKIENLGQEIEQLNNKLQQKSSRLKLLQNMKDDYDGFYRGVKNILKLREKFPGVIGVIADLIEVDREYMQAVETALGKRLQNLVVEDEDTAQEALKYLRRNNRGRATFLPLNLITPRPYKINSTIEGIAGNLGLASAFVDCNSRVESVVNYLLGRTLMARDLETAIEITKRADGRYRIVTLSGEIIRPGGAITGGSKNNAETGLLNRANEIERLEDVLADLQEKINCKKQQIKDLKEGAAQIENELAKNRECLHSLELRENSVKKELQTEEEKTEMLKERKAEIRAELAEKSGTLTELRKKNSRLGEQYRSLKNSGKSELNKIEELEEEIDDLEEKEEGLEEEATAAKIQIATLEQNEENLRIERDKLAEELSSTREKYRSAEQVLEETTARLNEIRIKRKQIKEDIVDYKKREETAGQNCDKLREAVHGKKELVTELAENKENNQHKIKKLREKLHKVELKINRLRNRCRSDEEKLAEKYGIDPENDSLQDRIKITEHKEAGAKVKELKRAIDRLGVINRGAIQECEELEKRVNYLKQQRDDLLQARRSTEQIIVELEDNMGQLFLDSFRKVKENFEEIFTELFSGGKAELKLEDEDNLLETGVRISAQPPGKKLKKLSLMSGGERALTAIALVFAFLQVNPSPFYILDEIDSPLDDTNVVRFGRFLEKYSQKAQFVLITHRKYMMTRVDSLYGVTMEDTGVSKLVSLKINAGEEL